jgi:pyrroline-5-carboxylate reductase
MKLAFIGAGNMATALIGGLLQRGYLAQDIVAMDVLQDARARIEQRLAIVAVDDVASAVGNAQVVVLSVKPQQMREVAAQLRPCLRDQLLITIAAGIRIDDLSRWLAGYARIVRAMPNTPALVQAGITGVFAPASISAKEREHTQAILSAVGEVIWLDSEAQLDAITAVSGSGPAYVFYFIESLEQAAQQQGFGAEQARKLAMATFAGAVKLASTSPESPATLRVQVTSKGGTTERALQSLEAAGVKDAIGRAIAAAEQRSRELGEQLGSN